MVGLLEAMRASCRDSGGRVGGLRGWVGLGCCCCGGHAADESSGRVGGASAAGAAAIPPSFAGSGRSDAVVESGAGWAIPCCGAEASSRGRSVMKDDMKPVAAPEEAG